MEDVLKKIIPLVSAFLISAVPPAYSQVTTTTVVNVNGPLKQALDAGDLDLAGQIAQDILAKDERDFDALVASALVALAKKDPVSARKAATKAFANAPDFAKWQTARLVAQAHFESGNLTLAEFWLRRAVNNAPNAKAKAALAKEFQAVRRKNPLSIQLSFGIAPSDNVNGGSNEKVFYLGGIPFQLSADSLALSGVLMSAGTNLKYRLSESQKQATSVGFNLFERRAYLSNTAKASAPDVRNGDYTFASKEAYLEHRR